MNSEGNIIRYNNLQWLKMDRTFIKLLKQGHITILTLIGRFAKFKVNNSVLKQGLMDFVSLTSLL